MLALLLVALVIVVHLYLNKKKTGKTVDGGTRNFEAMELLKYLSNFCWTLANAIN